MNVIIIIIIIIFMVIAKFGTDVRESTMGGARNKCGRTATTANEDWGHRLKLLLWSTALGKTPQHFGALLRIQGSMMMTSQVAYHQVCKEALPYYVCKP